MTQKERDIQVLDFAYGNLAIDVPTTTQQSIYDAFCRIHKRKPEGIPEGWEIKE